MDEILKRDQNFIVVLGGVTDDANEYIRMFRVDPATGALLISAAGLGTGTVTSIAAGVGIAATPDPITTTGTIALSVPLQPIASLAGNSLKFLRVNAGETAVEYATVAAGLVVGSTSITSGTSTRILYNNAGVLGEYTLTGSGTVAVMQTSPTLITPVIGVATGTSLTTTGALRSAMSIILEDPGAGTNTVTIQSPTLAGSYTLTLPVDDGDSGQVLSTNGAGVLSWVSAGGVPTTITVANEATDTTCFIAFFTQATGDLGPKTNTNLTYNSNTGALGVTGALTATTFNGLTVTANGTNTLNIAAGKTLVVSNSLTMAGTDSTVMTFPTTSATIARTDAGNTFTGVSTASAWVLTSPTITTKISPTSDDGAPLGDTTHNFSDLFLASGAVINYANSNVVITHTSGILTMGTGTLKITTPTNVATSVVTIDGTQTFTNKTMTSSTNVLGGVTMTLGSDADGDTYYRASNVLTRLAKGTAGQVLTMNAGATAPEWKTPSSGATPAIMLSTLFETAGRFGISNISAGTGTFTTNGLVLDTSTTTTSGTKVSWGDPGTSPMAQSPTITMSAAAGGVPGTNFSLYVGLGNPSVTGTAIDYTSDHIGFKIVRTASGTVNVSATQGDGATENATVVSTGAGDYEFVIKVNGTSSADYYWRKDGGALSSATNLTSNLGTVGSNMTFAICNLATNTRTIINMKGASYSR